MELSQMKNEINVLGNDKNILSKQNNNLKNELSIKAKFLVLMIKF